MIESSYPESPLIEIEIQLMHLQHDYEQLNAECCRQQRLIDQQERRIESLENQLRTLSAGGEFSPEVAGE